MGKRSIFDTQKAILKTRNYKIGDKIIILYESYKRLCTIIAENEQIKFLDVKNGTKYAFSMILTTRNYKKTTKLHGDLTCSEVKCSNCILKDLKGCKSEDESETFFAKIDKIRLTNPDLFLFYYDFLKKPF